MNGQHTHRLVKQEDHVHGNVNLCLLVPFSYLPDFSWDQYPQRDTHIEVVSAHVCRCVWGVLYLPDAI